MFIYNQFLMPSCLYFIVPAAPLNVKLTLDKSKIATMCWDPPSEKAGEANGYEIDWSINHVKQDIIKIKQSHCHTFSELKPKAIIEAAVRAHFSDSHFVKRKYMGPFSETIRFTMPMKNTG